jgi:hypothetical protein
VTANLASIGVICEDRLGQTSSSALIHVVNRDQCKLILLTLLWIILVAQS